MNTTKAIIILVVFITGIILGYKQFVINPAEGAVETVEYAFLEPQTIQLAVGETASYGDLQITLLGVLNDYRCPVDAECIEAGAVNTNINLSLQGNSQDIFYSSDSVPLLFGEYQFSITEINPPLLQEGLITQEEYQIGFLLEKIVQPEGEVNSDVSNIPQEISEEGYACINLGGQWSQEFSECLGVSGETCQELGGAWNECASACRNNPEAEVCTLQCVQVCTFNRR